MHTRREFLKKSALLSGGIGLSAFLPASVQRAFAINPEPGSSYLDAEHVVILMQENRSFDHAFGSLQGVRGFNDPRSITLPNGNPVWVQQNAAADTYAPFRLDIKDTNATWMGYLPHTRSSQVDAFNFGKFDKWLDAKRSPNKKYSDLPLTMGYYTREDLPFHYAMADAFTICDQHFSSAMTSTWPNRHYMWTGTIREEQNASARAHIRNDLDFAEAKWRTFPELLEDNGVSWKIYQNDLNCGEERDKEERDWLANFICNMMEYFSQYNIKFANRFIQSLHEQERLLPGQIDVLKGKIKAMPVTDAGIKKLQKDLDKKQEALSKVKMDLQLYTRANYEKLSQKQRNLHEKAFTINNGDPSYQELTTLKYMDGATEREINVPKGDILYQLRKDADNDQLPAVSWLVAPENFSDHPAAPWYGAWYISEILDILTKNPEVWKKTIFILTYDENDGYFDHVPPFIPPDLSKPGTGKCSAGIATDQEFIKLEAELAEGINKNEARGGAIGLGYRVPMIIASPWSRGGKVCSQVFDHTSSLQFLEQFLSHKLGRKIVEDNIGQWRRTICGDLTAAFSPFDKSKNKISFLKKGPYIESIYNAKFKQEPSGFKKLTQADIEQISQNKAASGLLPKQEPGIRPSCALPYELYADGKLSADKKGFEIRMQAGNVLFKEKSAGSPFKVYAPGNFLNDKGQIPEASKSWDYAVKAGDTLTDSWTLSAFENNNYHLRLYGPNGFFREFEGSSADPDIAVLFGDHLNGSTGPELLIVNRNPDKAYTISIKHHGYQHPDVISEFSNHQKNMPISVHTEKTHGWYDFTIKVKGHDDFEMRYAGRLENGKASFSDPVMGNVQH